MANRVVDLPSGAKLTIQPAPFAEAKALYQAVLDEIKHIDFSTQDEMSKLLKDLLCYGFSSKKIEAALYKCMDRVLYNGLKITDETFEPVDARGDYLVVIFEVAKENVEPFMKSLYAQYGQVLASLVKDPA